MALKTYKPTTPAQRQLVLVDRSGLYKGKPIKALTVGKISTGGRNNLGRITTRFRGGGHKRSLRLVDFKRTKHDQPAQVERIEYDPNRTGFIALIKYQDGELAYILAPQRLAVGDVIVSGEHVDVKPGNAMPAGNIPIGTIVHNVEIKIGKGGQIARSAGTYAQIVGRDADYVALRLNSAEPEFFMRPADSREPRFRLLRTPVKGGHRVVENVSIFVTGEEKHKATDIEIQTWTPATGVFRYTLDQRLEPGEYAFVEMTADGVNGYVWDFGIDLPGSKSSK